ncbi:TetR/AcrR family transcriptional regulator [Lacticaseibacillus pantheris]|jgi:AcrR family transcriptional regulator|uniref:TetR/AcrR family transcriptional regulator n=2 Tax=Lacticaseibacillus TaxID=2759736 RepID=UPI00265924C8|nr:TetR/AcrR family transcriptional regulator [Lacticaseibacillus pantheris]WKF85495.1 TetR/AcrR family transcriptional regulator [Lacticaseibacillus pantheris]
MTHESLSTRQQIINAAIRQIGDEGYHQISLRHLAGQVGMTTGAVYKNFGSKEELFRAVTVILSNQLADEIAAQLDASIPPKQQLLVIADQLMNKFQSDAFTMDFLFFNPVAQRLLSGTKSAHEFSFYNLVMGVINQLKGEFEQLDTERFFVQIWSFIQGYGLLIINHVAPYNRDLLSMTLTAFLKV